MSGRIESAVGSDEYIIAELYLRLIQNNAVDIGIEILAYLYIVAVIAMEWLFYQKFMSGFTE